MTVTGSAPTYTATITPVSGQEGTLSISIADGAVQDSGTPVMNYPASNTISVEVDAVDPQVSSITGPSTTQNGNFNVTITFDEAVSDFEPGELTVSGGRAHPQVGQRGTMGTIRILGL